MTRQGYRRTWVLVADGTKALMLFNRGDEEVPLLEPIRKAEHDLAPTREQGTSAPGRYADTPVGQRSAFEETDWQRLEKERFAKEIAGQLSKAAMANAYDDLVLVAPPRILGELRSELHKEAAQRVKLELAKDLTHHPMDQIEAQIRDALAEQSR